MKHNKNQQSFELFDCSLLNQLIRKREKKKKKSEFVNFIKDFFGNNIYQNKKAKPQMCTHNSNAHVLDKEYYTARSCSERHCLFRVILMPNINESLFSSDRDKIYWTIPFYVCRDVNWFRSLYADSEFKS